MTRSSRPWALMALLLLLLAEPANAEAPALPAPDSALQTIFQQIPLSSDALYTQMPVLLKEMQQRRLDDREVLVQLMLFLRTLNDREDNWAAWAIYTTQVKVAMRASGFIVLVAVGPFLESDDPITASVADAMLVAGGAFRLKSFGYDPRFDEVESYLSSASLDAAPTRLSIHLFQTDPDAALLALSKAFVTDPKERERMMTIRLQVARDILTMRLDKDDRSREALRRRVFDLSADDHWLVRAYAASFISKLHFANDQAPIDNLADDANPVVADRGRFLQERRAMKRR